MIVISLQWTLRKLPTIANDDSNNNYNGNSLQHTTDKDVPVFVIVNTSIINNGNVGSSDDDEAFFNLSMNIQQQKQQQHCFALNSDAWLRGPRLGNIPLEEPAATINERQPSFSSTTDDDDDHYHDDWMDRIMQPHRLLDHINTITATQSLCYPTSRFHHPSTTTITDWQIKLIFAAIHRTCHQPAYSEYLLRKSCGFHTVGGGGGGIRKNTNNKVKKKYEQQQQQPTASSSSYDDHDHYDYEHISNFDYECPHAKYLITVLQSVGMGALVRGSIVPAMIMALSTNRIPLFISHLDPNPFLQKRESSTTLSNTTSSTTRTTTNLATLLASPMLLVSCPRHDLQCIFMPISPCVITWDDLRGHTTTYNNNTTTTTTDDNDDNDVVILNPVEARLLKRQGQYSNPRHEHVRILIYEARVNEPFVPPMVRHVLHRTIHEMIQEWNDNYTNNTKKKVANSTTTTQENDKERRQHPPEDDDITERHETQYKLMMAAADSLLPNPNIPSYPYNMTLDEIPWIILRAIELYVLRPNAHAQQRISLQVTAAATIAAAAEDGNMSSSTSTSTGGHIHLLANTNSHGTTKGHVRRQYFGLPIRGSDKCRFESTCLSFDRYMERIVMKWNQHRIPGTKGTILLTSEDPTILPLRLVYQNNVSFPLDIFINPHDVQQGHGRPKWYHDADATMISSLAALKLQLQSNVVVLNCCSNFHLLVLELMKAGCGADPNITFSQLECLNEIPDVKYRICCGRDKDPICKPLWAQHKANTNLTAIKERAIDIAIVHRTMEVFH